MSLMENLIGVNKFENQIYYKRVDHMDLNHIETIEDWYDNQSLEVIIEKINDDYNSKKDTEQIIRLEKFIRGILE